MRPEFENKKLGTFVCWRNPLYSPYPPHYIPWCKSHQKPYNSSFVQRFENTPKLNKLLHQLHASPVFNANNNMDTKTTRSDSVSSAASTGAPVVPVASTSSARRGSGTLFASLHENKRPNDPRVQARRQSLHEQRPTPGMFGKMWNT